jgi:hypothetical protein
MRCCLANRPGSRHACFQGFDCPALSHERPIIASDGCLSGLSSLTSKLKGSGLWLVACGIYRSSGEKLAGVAICSVRWSEKLAW